MITILTYIADPIDSEKATTAMCFGNPKEVNTGIKMTASAITAPTPYELVKISDVTKQIKIDAMTGCL
ncbi:hypothetical protein GCM10025884_08790 [Leuconostoc gelidum subsp. gelidum]|nr:hypothetical protein GCM10025884_08790 [Leuconostoc gelidum subsp. gelidum]